MSSAQEAPSQKVQVPSVLDMLVHLGGHDSQVVSVHVSTVERISVPAGRRNSDGVTERACV